MNARKYPVLVRCRNKTTGVVGYAWSSNPDEDRAATLEARRQCAGTDMGMGLGSSGCPMCGGMHSSAIHPTEASHE